MFQPDSFSGGKLPFFRVHCFKGSCLSPEAFLKKLNLSGLADSFS